MIYLFRMISDENPDFYRDLVADGSDTFLDLHHVLQKELDYDASQLASFFICNENWEKELEITLIDMIQEPGISSYIMDQVSLEEHINEPNQRMLYLFDFFSDRAFFMEVIEMSDRDSPRPTPFIGQRQGDPPPQLALDELLDETGQAEDMDPMDDSDNLRIDDLDPDMLDDGMPEDY